MSTLKIMFMVWVIRVLSFMLYHLNFDRERTGYLIGEGETIADNLLNFDGGKE